VEYELSQVTVYEDSTWPNPQATPTYTECEAGCAQGSLPRRTVGRGEDMMYVSAQDILADITVKQAEFDNWTAVVNSVNKFSEQASFNVLDGLFSALSTDAETDYTVTPPEPLPYDGYTFENTNSQAGYGMLTTGRYYNTLLGSRSGYKPWGALGQGTAKNRSVNLSGTDEERAMLITISLNHDDLDDDNQEDNW